MAKQPIEQQKVGNGVQYSIFENESVNGKWLSVTIARAYKDGDETKFATTFRKNDLLFVAKAAEMAFSWCLEQAKNAKREANQE